MYKFFVKNEKIEDKIEIIGDDVNHIKNVLRLKKGDSILIGNKITSKTYNCEIEDVMEEKIICNNINEIENTTEALTYIHIFQGLPKADKFEFIIEKCTEIGVKEITPVIMKRTVVKLGDKDKLKKMLRWQKIAEVSAKQSKRDCILKINDIIDFKNIFKKVEKYDIVLVAYENEKTTTLKKVLNKLKSNKPLKIAVIIGPEGGIDDDEIELCNINNVNCISLGNRILRTETASIVVASNILYELED